MKKELGHAMDELGSTNHNSVEDRASASCAALDSSGLPQHGPLIEVSESDGVLNVYADFRSMPGLSSLENINVEFAQQGMILTCDAVQRYVPLPTDAQIEHARVMIAGGIVRMSVPTADLGHRWRSIVMW
ncbi:MAG: hypothetical protein R3B37_04350 [Nitrospira sp.]|nr:hypothetical protein [Nitrospira sp.]